MTTGKNIPQEVEKTLESLEGIQRAEANPFLFTRIKAKMQRQQDNVWEKVFFFINRPAIAIAVVLLVMGINMLAVWGSGANESLATDTGSANVSEIANEYNLIASAENYVYENFNNE
jgi:hypothetical protein